MTRLVDLPPLTSLLLHKLRVDAWHDFVELLAMRKNMSDRILREKKVLFSSQRTS